MVPSFFFVCGLLFTVFCSIEAQTLQKRFTFTQNMKNYVLGLHNDLRKKVAAGQVPGQPRATNMVMLAWDEPLANKANTYSQNCYGLKHSDGRNQLGYQWVGENLAYTWMGKVNMSTDAELQKQFKIGFDMWANEYKDFSFPNSCRSMCGHYTQLVWAKTTKVGCGMSQCDGLGTVPGRGTNYGMIVCNYAPGGNWNNEDPYKR